MGKLVINGGRPLYGTVDIQGAKNAVLPIFAAAILAVGETKINNVPVLADVNNMGKILESLGADIKREGKSVYINTENIDSYEIPDPLAKELRSSIFLLGSVLGRKGRAKVAYPGGCDIGIRPINMHIKALEEMNVHITKDAGFIFCDAKNIRSADLVLDYPSVGATENIILAAAKTKGRTTITNAAREPEIVDLQNFINEMGGDVKGAGTSFVEIEGVEELSSIEYTVMPDRIVAGTYAIAAAITGGEIVLKNCQWDIIGALLAKMSKTSCKIKQEGDSIIVQAVRNPESVDFVETQPYPGFPTDLQSPMMALQTVSNGVSVITENIFENRFHQVNELIKMGAKIRVVREKSAIITGVKRLHGTVVDAGDLRGGASLVLAGLNASGTTVINNVKHIDRGYEDIENVLQSLGADIRRI